MTSSKAEFNHRSGYTLYERIFGALTGSMVALPPTISVLLNYNQLSAATMLPADNALAAGTVALGTLVMHGTIGYLGGREFLRLLRSSAVKTLRPRQ